MACRLSSLVFPDRANRSSGERSEPLRRAAGGKRSGESLVAGALVVAAFPERLEVLTALTGTCVLVWMPWSGHGGELGAALACDALAFFLRVGFALPFKCQFVLEPSNLDCLWPFGSGDHA